ncbi:MAG: RcnB family protein [Pseudoxanthomonas sp.]
MKRTFLALLSVPVLALALGAPAQARDHHDRDRRGSDRHYVDHGRSYYRAPPVVYYRSAPRPDYYRPPPPRWVVGRPYYAYYDGPAYYVDDYYRYPVRRPPPGYRWVRSDTGDLLLVAITTGIIADILLHH